MKYIILFLFLCGAQPLIAQDDAAYEKVLSSFFEQFNNENVTAIHELYSAEMKEYMPVENATQFIKGMHGQFGNIKSHKFASEEEGVRTYHVTFDKGMLSLEFQIDTDSKITGLVFQEL